MNKELEAKLRELAEHGSKLYRVGCDERDALSYEEVAALANAVLELSDWQSGSLKVLRDLAAALGVNTAQTALEKWEADAERFYRETGHMRPGKDDARHCHSLDERNLAWDRWIKAKP